MDKITTILLIVAAILIIMFILFATGITNLNMDSANFNPNSQSNNGIGLSLGSNNASIKILSNTKLTKNSKVVVQLLDKNNQPMVNQYVSCTFFSESSNYGDSYMALTNEQGIGEFSTDYLNPGKYRISLEYKSYDDNIGSCLMDNNIEVI